MVLCVFIDFICFDVSACESLHDDGAHDDDHDDHRGNNAMLMKRDAVDSDSDYDV